MDSQSLVLVHTVDPLTLDHAHSLVHRQSLALVLISSAPHIPLVVKLTDARATRAGIRTHNPRQRALSRAPQPASPDADSSPPPPASTTATASHIPWRIENKYYTADVTFRVLEHGDEGEGDEPAVIVLARADADPSSTAILSALLGSLSSRSPDPPDVALLVTIPSNFSLAPHEPSSSTPDPRADLPDDAAWQDLALSHGFEWLHLAPSSADEGIARILGALHAHMWEGMERVDVSRLNGVGRRRRRRSVTSEDEEGDAEDEWSALNGAGAPPLPKPRRPYGSTTTTEHLAFPEMFLPSIPRRAPPSNGTVGHGSFDDDFAPFVSAPDSRSAAHDQPASFSPFPSSPPSSTSALPAQPPDAPPSPPHLYRPLSFSFPDSHRPLSLDSDADDVLEDLFSRISLARAQANVEGMGMEERREWAEKVVRDLLWGAVGSDDDEEVE
ncbi:hypothetical protein Rt10032_c02g1204 [Rhodotorula toruloides]|uniref:Uncharacterized protein n=1 Tax=Rhodotorula toruloides TaxID=5286 RepID=A0A511K9X7_RHOTO|nr:hypothetical protein Rt10032_c02g1204 [Rhodotorula toruloides]